MKRNRASIITALFLLLLGGSVGIFLVGCQVANHDSMFRLTPADLKNIQQSQKIFDTKNKIGLMRASMGVLQDMGYTIDYTSDPLGILVASKQQIHKNSKFLDQLKADVTSSFEKAFLGVAALPTPFYKKKVTRAMITFSLMGQQEVRVRINFQESNQKKYYDSDNNEREKNSFFSIEEKNMYSNFFQKLSKSFFQYKENIE